MRLSGTVDSREISYIFGINYQHDDIFDHVAYLFDGASGFGRGAYVDQPYDLTNRSIGAFANIDWKVADQLTLTAGIRYTDSKQTLNGCLTGNAVFAGQLGFLAGLANPAAAPDYVAGGCLTINDTGPTPDYRPIAADIKQKQDNWSWRMGINCKPSDNALLYAQVSRGYKAGTFPVLGILFQSLLRNLSQEQLTAYEIGTKLQLADRRVQFNVAAFYYDYIDKQFFNYVPVPLIGQSAAFVNILKSKAKGLDAEVVANPIDRLTLRGGLTYVHTRIGTFEGFNALGQPVSSSGKEFNFAPPWSATFDAEYRQPVSDSMKILVGFGGLYNSRTFSDLGETPETSIPARTVLDARVGVLSDNGWRLTGWVRNLTDKIYWTSLGFSGDTQVRFAGMPRTFGATFSADF